MHYLKPHANVAGVGLLNQQGDNLVGVEADELVGGFDALGFLHTLELADVLFRRGTPTRGAQQQGPQGKSRATQFLIFKKRADHKKSPRD